MWFTKTTWREPIDTPIEDDDDEPGWHINVNGSSRALCGEETETDGDLDDEDAPLSKGCIACMEIDRLRDMIEDMGGSPDPQ